MCVCVRFHVMRACKKLANESVCCYVIFMFVIMCGYACVRACACVDTKSKALSHWNDWMHHLFMFVDIGVPARHI